MHRSKPFTKRRRRQPHEGQSERHHPALVRLRIVLSTPTLPRLLVLSLLLVATLAVVRLLRSTSISNDEKPEAGAFEEAPAAALDFLAFNFSAFDFKPASSGGNATSGGGFDAVKLFDAGDSGALGPSPKKRRTDRRTASEPPPGPRGASPDFRHLDDELSREESIAAIRSQHVMEQ